MPNTRPTMGFRLPPGGFPPGPIPFVRGTGPRQRGILLLPSYCVGVYFASVEFG